MRQLIIDFNVENLWRYKKPRACNQSKTSTIKNKNWIQGFTELKWTNPSRTTWLVPFTFSFSPSSSEAHLESTPSSISASSWILTRGKWILLKTKRMRYECFRNQPMFIFIKSKKKKDSWKTYGIFLGGKLPQNGNEWKVLSRLLLFFSKNMRKFDFKWEWSP